MFDHAQESEGRPLRRDAGDVPLIRRSRSRASPLVSRRMFGAGLAAASFGLLARTRQARAGDVSDVDAVKEYLQAIKDHACNVSEYIDTYKLQGPLKDPEHIAYVTVKVEGGAAIGQGLLNSQTSLLYAPPGIWLYWTPVDSFGLTLQETAYLSCEQACEALDDYCAMYPSGPFDSAGEKLWRTQALYCRLYDIAGL